MTAHQRLQEDHGLPTHYVETLYLNQIIAAVKVALHNLSPEGTRPITAQLLAEWPLVHRTHFSGCSIFTHDFSYIPKREDRHDIHREDMSRIDVFIKALQQGLEEGQLTKYVTLADVSAIAMTIPRLEACAERTVWK
jgi:hypothetical protein